MDYQYSYDSGAGDVLGLLGFSLGFIAIMQVLIIAFTLFTAYCMGKMFRKAGKPLWYAFIPILNNYTKAEIAFGPQYGYVGLLPLLPLITFLIAWIPVLGWIASAVINIGVVVLGFVLEYSFISKYTGGGALPVVGCFANWLAYIIVGFGGYQYYGPSNYVPVFTFLPAMGDAVSGNYQSGMNNQYNYGGQAYSGPQGMNNMNNGYGQGQQSGNGQNINLNKNQGQNGYGQNMNNGYGQQPQGQNNYGQRPQGQNNYGQQGQGQNMNSGYGQQPQGQNNYGQRPQGSGYNPNMSMNGQGMNGYGQQPQNQGFGQRPVQNNQQQYSNNQGYNPNMNMGGQNQNQGGYGQQPRQ